mmetsp:Transcript_9552/g.19061  ORF Transcript_9552/g.19061 Transcript_9552/m.19061 type:complete len:310 (+) Transcript_9552:41-970(+)|eukprot:CAMPEP_0182485692 /NCGR_PEP_ID=MMETSP1319-20130603/45706_1 /TAXON_ID=172717 /ORGANISM="Bolidomonas pacifica, Strain RCC208" /LENGTH=309 /DNA_ID=CAMNT_0024687707 /DNA_START=31 /DNA_END=960 /DNA_ORIENTATION=-
MDPFYSNPSNLPLLCSHLRSPSGPPSREGVLSGQRVLYVKGDKLLTYLHDKPKKWPRSLPRVQDRVTAAEVAAELVKAQHVLRCVKQGKGTLAISPEKDFAEDGYYVWIWEGDQSMNRGLLFLIIAAFLLVTCFPLWPNVMKAWVWYLSCTLLVAIVGLCIVRGVAFLVVWIGGYHFWILPNLFDEQLGVAESFVPLFSLTAGGSDTHARLFRFFIFAFFAGFVHWAVSQPTEFDGMISAQKSFLDDLYSGNLLSDMSQQAQDDIDKVKLKSLDDLLQELDEVEDDEAAEMVIEQLMEEDERGGEEKDL